MTIDIVPSPAARAALAQASARWPGRSTAADGIVGDAAHQERTSFHNAYLVMKTGAEQYGVVEAARGMALAFDLTHDPAHGVDSDVVARALVAERHPAVVEAITRGRIWTRQRAAEGFRHYDGPNRHEHHCHVSIDPHHFDFAGVWFREIVLDDHAAGPREIRLADPRMKGDDVRRLQQALGLAADGVWGPGSDTALRQFQSAQGLAVDGVAGPATLAALAHRGHSGGGGFPLGANHVFAVRSPSPEVHSGVAPADREPIRHLQRALAAAGFPCEPDGRFGAQTEAAVRAFQQARGLPVDGVVGPRTWTALEKSLHPA